MTMMGSNRPISRMLFRIAIRLLRGKKRAHEQAWFPYLRIVKASPHLKGKIVYREEEIAHLECLENVAQSGVPRAIHIVGSGPSVTRCNLKLIDTQQALLLNGSISLIAREIPHPFAIAIEDERFVWRHFRDLMTKVNAGTLCLLSVEVIRAICENDLGWLGDKRIVLIDDIRKPYGRESRSLEELQKISSLTIDASAKAGFSGDPAIGVFKGGSVVVSAMQFAIALKPRMIGLWGIDLSNAGLPRFYETPANMAYSGIVVGQRHIVSHLVLAKSAAAEAGTDILNFSAVSALRQAGFGYADSFSSDVLPSPPQKFPEIKL